MLAGADSRRGLVHDVRIIIHPAGLVKGIVEVASNFDFRR
jgi:hypothetical protein